MMLSRGDLFLVTREHTVVSAVSSALSVNGEWSERSVCRTVHDLGSMLQRTPRAAVVVDIDPTPEQSLSELDFVTRRFGEARFIVVSNAFNSDLVLQAMQAGARHFMLKASIAAEHATAPSASQTNWKRIVALYDALYRQQPSAVIALNRAVAIAMRDSPAAGLQELDRLNVRAVINFHLYHAARADLLRRTGDIDGARQAYQRALSLATQEPERRFLARQLEHLEAPDDRSWE